MTAVTLLGQPPRSLAAHNEGADVAEPALPVRPCRRL